MQIDKTLKKLNFTDKEITVYLVIIELGSAKVNTISRKTDINRTTVYDVLETLVSKGLVSKIKKGKIMSFTAMDPKQLIAYSEREKQETIKEFDDNEKSIESIIPELISLQNIYTDKPKVQMFEGEKGMREAYEDTLNSKEIILAYANVNTMHKALPNFFPEYYKRRAAKKIFIKAIMPKNVESEERSKLDQEEMRESRFLNDENQVFSPEINLYNNKMLIVSWKEKIAVIIESKELVDLQKMTFNIVWNTLQKNV